MTRPERGHGPLSGTTVLELHAPGARCAAVLEALGAEVLTVQDAKPGVRVAPAGSRSITMDLSAPEAVPVMERLASRAQVVVADPGALAKLGLDDFALRAVNPGIVLCSQACADAAQAALAAAAVVAALREPGGGEVIVPTLGSASPAGVHSRELLVELGFDDADIANFVRSGVVQVD